MNKDRNNKLKKTTTGKRLERTKERKKENIKERTKDKIKNIKRTHRRTDNYKKERHTYNKYIV